MPCSFECFRVKLRSRFLWVWYQKGRVTPERRLIDQGTLSWRVLLCPQWACKHLYHLPLNPGITLQWWMRKKQGGIQEQGWQSPVSRQHTVGQWQRNGSRLGRPRGKRGLINGSCFGPNTQLADLTKCSVSSLPLFFLAWYNVCPQLTGGGEGGSGCRCDGGSKSQRLYSGFFYSISCDYHLNVSR